MLISSKSTSSEKLEIMAQYVYRDQILPLLPGDDAVMRESSISCGLGAVWPRLRKGGMYDVKSRRIGCEQLGG